MTSVTPPSILLGVKVTLAGGAMVDLATTDELASMHERIATLLEKPTAHGQRIAGFANTGAGPLVIDLGSPPMGMIWLPQYLTVTGADAHLGAGNIVIANVSAAAFIGRLIRAGELALGPPVTGEDMAGCVGAGITVPQSVQLPDKACVYQNEHLYVVIAGSGVAAGSASVYRASAFVIELAFTDSALV